MSSQNQDSLLIVKEEYINILQDLKNSSKPMINTLTTIAGENIGVANAIVSAIEQQLFKVDVARRLPLIYLIDSILKNIGGFYIPTFAYNMPYVFAETYKSVDSKTKSAMDRVLRTWEFYAPTQRPIFDFSVLQAIKSGVASEAMPLSSMPAYNDASIQQAQKQQLMQGVQQMLSVTGTLDQQSLELLQQLLTNHKSAFPGSPQRLSDELVAQITSKIAQATAEHSDTQNKPIFVPLESTEINKKSPDLVTRKAECIYPKQATQCQQCGLRFLHDTFHEAGVGTSSKMLPHLDWHFRENKKMRARTPKFESRNWFSKRSEWVQPQGLGPDTQFTTTFAQDKTSADASAQLFADESSNSKIDSSKESTLLLSPSAKQEADKHSVPYDVNLQNAICAVCGEPLTKSWDDESEQWVLKNAVKMATAVPVQPETDSPAEPEETATDTNKRKAQETPAPAPKRTTASFTLYHWTCFKDLN